MKKYPKPYRVVGTLVTYSEYKTCKECGVEKPNNDANFPRKLHRFRDMHTTRDVCKQCVAKKIRDGIHSSWSYRNRRGLPSVTGEEVREEGSEPSGEEFREGS